MFVLALTRISDAGLEVERRDREVQRGRAAGHRDAVLARRRSRRTRARSDSISSPNEPGDLAAPNGVGDRLDLLVADRRARRPGSRRLARRPCPPRPRRTAPASRDSAWKSSTTLIAWHAVDRARSRRRRSSRTSRKSRRSSVKSWTSTTPRWTTNICWRSSIVARHGLVVVRLLLVAGPVREQAELERRLGGEKNVVFSTPVSGPDDLGIRRAAVLDDLDAHCFSSLLRSRCRSHPASAIRAVARRGPSAELPVEPPAQSRRTGEPYRATLQTLRSHGSIVSTRPEGTAAHRRTTRQPLETTRDSPRCAS